jgi:pimeloyl-ACP methyl ester carboxylesterase
MLGLMPKDMPKVVIPDADHHVMLDQPLAFVAAIRALLEVWP